MNTLKHIKEELESLGSNLPFPAEKPFFSVPEGYFEKFAASVMARIKHVDDVSVFDELNKLSPALSLIKKQMPFSVPEGYFSTLGKQLPLLTRDEEISALLADHHKRMPFEVPAGYFTDLPASILGKLTRPAGKLVSIKRNNWIKMAVAAMIIGIIAMSGVYYFNEKSPAIDPLMQPGQWVAKNLEGISNQTLDDFIKTADFNASENIAKTSDNNFDIRNMLNEVPDIELDAFLAALPLDDDELSLIN